ncbi:aldehyde dehydrogenase family protein [Rhodococcus koreensis]|uniref:aldehyde dehydrogenase family protein n=1 Tax=Rhodococcus koreensis TaxID=99653 RepID=UPI0036DEBF5E
MIDTLPEIDRSGPKVHLHIGDRILDAGSAGVHRRVNPSTGEVDGEIPLAGATEIDEAVRAAHAAYPAWRRTPGPERRRLLLKLADLLEANGPEFGRRTTIDMGMNYVPQLGMLGEWPRYYAGWADKITSDVTGLGTSGGEFAYTIAEPYGVIGVIITWNGPVGSMCMKLPPALAAGNTVVVKPPELAPYGPELFAELVKEAGFPPGVINIVPGGREAGEALVTHPLVQKISFTGGPATAKAILRSTAETMKPTLLELGGKSANLIFEDADLDSACTHAAVMSVGFLAGQGCAFPTRMLVQDTIYEDVVQRIEKIVSGFVLGDPFDPRTTTGPVVNQAAVDRILGFIEGAKRDGARLVIGGKRAGGELAQGCFIEPTVFADVDPDSELAQGEVFGPVLSIIKFSTEDEAIEIANGTPYALAAYIRTSDVTRAHRVAEQLVAGTISINGASNLAADKPFGGFNLSGTGKEGGKAGLDEFLRIKSVGVGMGTGAFGGY